MQRCLQSCKRQKWSATAKSELLVYKAMTEAEKKKKYRIQNAHPRFMYFNIETDKRQLRHYTIAIDLGFEVFHVDPTAIDEAAPFWDVATERSRKCRLKIPFTSGRFWYTSCKRGFLVD